MTQPTNYLMILDKDKFACCDGVVSLYPCQKLPPCAINIATEPSDQIIYAIDRQDVSPSLLPAQVDFISFRQLMGDLTAQQANQLAKAMQLIRWRQEHQFCSRCGSPTQQHPINLAMICLRCDYHQYPRVQPCIITAVVNTTSDKPQILLAQHQRSKDSQMYTVLAGFVEAGESLEQCVHREVMEEVGLSVTNLRYFGSQPWPFPSNLMVGFIADYQSGDINIDTNELIDAQFFDIDLLDHAESPITPPKGTIAYQLIDWVKQHYQS